jgi:hypothetical protein
MSETLNLISGLNQLEPRTYNLAAVVQIPAGAQIVGTPGKTILNNPSGPLGYSYHITGDNVSLAGIIFNGGGVYLEKSGNWNNNIAIDNCEFHLNAGGAKRCAIEFGSGLKNSKITNNLFTGYNGAFGMYTDFGYNNLTIANNEFVNISAGIHLDANNSSANLLAEQNYFVGMKGMGMEFQDNATGLIFQDNWYEHPNLSATYAQNTNSMAFSLILDKGSNITIQRNAVIAPERPDGVGCRIGFEVGGDNSIVQDNYINGVNCAVASNDGSGTSSIHIRNNHFENFIPNSQGWLGGINMKAVVENVNNGPAVQLSWDINRGRPHRNIRFGDPTTAAPTPAPIPTQAPVNSGFMMIATPTDPQTIQFAFANVPPGTETITVSCISTVGREVGAKVGPAFILKNSAQSFLQDGYHPGWQITLFAIALDVLGKVLQEIAVELLMPGDSTVAWPPPG